MRIFYFLLPFIISGPLLMAAEKASQSESTTAIVQPLVKESVLSENQSILLREQKLSYDVHGGTIRVKSKAGKEPVDIHFIAYFAKTPPDTNNRPLAFCFNGGPGSSSVWLHMGFLGPKIVNLQEKTPSHGSFYKENPFSLLASCDLIFIDPASTGFSKSPEEGGEKNFFGVEEDIHAFADCIQALLTKFQRWQSPKLLIGESYGTTRAIGLTSCLQDEYFINIDGLVLISLVLDYQTVESLSSYDLTNILHLPTYAAVAHYHKRLNSPYAEKSLKELCAEVSSFAINEYAPVLLAGCRAPEIKKQTIASQLTDFTSLPQTFFSSHNLRLGPCIFVRKLLEDTASIVGRFDGRVTTWMPPNESPLRLTSGIDPSFYFVSSAFTCAINEYFTKELHVQKEDPYFVLSNAAFYLWNWNSKPFPYGPKYVTFTEELQHAFAKNPHLKVFVAAGYYDIATPFFAQQYSLDHLFLPEPLCKNIEFKVYEGGHMMYLDKGAQDELSTDLANFVMNVPCS